MKKILLMLTVILLSVAIASCSGKNDYEDNANTDKNNDIQQDSIANVTENGLVLNMNSNGTYSIVSSNNPSGNIVIPKAHNGIEITSIGEGCFKNCGNITEITIPDTITSIEKEAFKNCTGLKSITVPDSVKKIGSATFSGCSSLESITIPFVGEIPTTTTYTSSTSLFGYIFGKESYTGGSATKQYYGTGNTAEYYYIPSNLKTVTVGSVASCIGNFAFLNCDNITTLTIGNGVKSIGLAAISLCEELKTVTIGNGIKSIEPGAFLGSTKLENVYVNDLKNWCEIDFGDYSSTPFAYAKNLYLNNTLATEIEIPDGIETIKENAFYGCSTITKFIIPDSVKTIEKAAFYECSAITDLKIPAGITNIGDSAFAKCTSIINLNIPNGVTNIGDCAFSDCTSITNLSIPNSVTKIGADAFSGCTGVTKLTFNSTRCQDFSSDNQPFINLGDNTNGCTVIFGNNIKKIPEYLLYQSNLKSITIGSETENIGKYAFWGCSGLTNVTIHDGVKNIGEYAFARCSDLTSITIGKNVTTIETYTFSSCVKLTNINFNAISCGDFAYNDNIFNNAGTSADGITVTFGSSVKQIPANFLAGYSGGVMHPWTRPKIKAINIGNNVTSIGNAAFSRSEITSITIPNSVKNIGTDAFYNCPITSVTIPNSTISIGKYAFDRDTNLIFTDTSTWYRTSSESSFKNKTGGYASTKYDYGYYWYKI